MGSGPLDDPRLQAVEEALDSGRLDQAQNLLAAFQPTALHRQGISYLTTRLLFQRGRLSVAEVSSRMHQVLKSSHDFPQARALLAAAEDGRLTPQSLSAESGRPTNLAIPGPPALPTFPGPEPELPSPSLIDGDDDIDTDPLGGDGYDFEPPTLPELRGRRAPDSLDLSLDPLGPLTLSGAEFAPDSSDLRTTAPAVSGQDSLDPSEVTVTLQAPRGGVASAPQPAPTETPSLFSVLTLLDERRFEEALQRIGDGHDPRTPELTLMRARAYVGMGNHEAACAALEPLCQSTSIGPELRAGCARVLIEAEEPLLALDQAEMAHRLAPDSSAVVLTMAWALLRVERRDLDLTKRTTAATLLKQLDAAGGPTPALAHALLACIDAEEGLCKQALTHAARALELDPTSVDALVATAIARATRGQLTEAAEAWRKLLAASEDEASVLRPRLVKLGVRLQPASPSLGPERASPTSRRVWDPLESALISGEPDALLDAWNADCEPILARLDADPSELGLLAAIALTRAPGFCHFAPYDLSLWSLIRLEVALDLIFGKAPADPDTLEGRLGAQLVLSAYVGETLRRAYDGRWNGNLAEPHEARVETRVATLAPFDVVHTRLLTGGPLALERLVTLESAHRSVDQWSRYTEDQATPPTPWAPHPWPTLEDLGAYGRALSRSVVSMYCEQFADTRLDHGMDGLAALDSYLALVAPPAAPAIAPSPVVRRTAVFVGAYVGEVLRSHWGGQWIASDAPEPARYVLEVGSIVTRPVQQVYSRLCGQQPTTLTEYAARLTSQLGP